MRISLEFVGWVFGDLEIRCFWLFCVLFWGVDGDGQIGCGGVWF